jgi:conjugal transfer pilus assembly protein TraD
MPSSSNQSPEPTPGSLNPLEPLEKLAHWLTLAVVHGLLGMAIGLTCAWMMHRRHLRWSWGPIGFVVVILARPLLGGATSVLAIAALSATRQSRRWHREEIEAGADLAEIADARRGPSDALRTFVRRTLPRLLERWAPARGLVTSTKEDWFRGNRLILGEEEDGSPVSIPLGGSSGGTHTLVVGATRSGKTVTMTWMAVRAIEHGMGAIVIDPKGDSDLCRELQDAALAAGRPFLQWTPQGPSMYNPYARGSETEIADKVVAGERFTEPHYLRQAQRFLGHEVRTLRQAGLEVSLQGIVDHLDAARLELLLRSLPASAAQKTNTYLDSLTGRQKSDLGGVRDRLAIMAESDIGPWLDPQTQGVDRLDLLDAAKARAVVYFNLEADRRPLLAQMLGAAIVQDLQTMVAALQGRPVPTLVAIDEFSAIVPERIVGLFGRASGAGVSLVLGTQELADLRLPGQERLLDQIMGNLSVLIAHRQVVPDSAELIASLAGTKGAWKTSQSSDGRTNRTRTREGLLEADEVTRLGQGWAAVIALVDGGRVRVTHVFSPRSH